MKVSNGLKPVRENNIGLKESKLMILVDSREQLPYWSGSQCLKTPLVVGDYTTIKLLNKFHIDRKSAIDLYGTITSGHMRFKKEILRAKDHNIELMIYVETTREKFINKQFPRGDKLKYPSQGLERILNTYKERYGLIFVWHKDRMETLNSVLKKLKLKQKFYEHLNE